MAELGVKRGIEKSTILMIDENADRLYALKSDVAEFLPNCHIETALSGQEAVKITQSVQVDVALIEVQMAEMSGIELCRELQLKSSAEFPILLLTAHDSTPAMRAEGLDAGASDFLSYPLDNVELFAKINVLLRIRQSEQMIRKYEFIVNTTSDMMTIIDENGYYEAVNDAWCHMFSKKREDVLGRTIAEVWGESVFNTHIREKFEKSLVGELVRYQSAIETPQYGTVECDITFSRFRQPKSNVTHVVVVMHDITEEVKSRKREHEQAVELKAIFDSTPILMLLVDEEMKVLRINHAGVIQAEISENDALGKLPGEILKCEHRPVEGPCGSSAHCDSCFVRKALVETLTSKTSQQRIEGKLSILKEGVQKSVHVLISTSYLTVRGKDAVLLSLFDITERKAQEEEIRVSNERLSQAIRSGGLGMFELDMFTMNLVVGELFYDICDIAPETPSEEMTELWFSKIHPDDRVRVEEALSRAINELGDGIYHVEHRYMHSQRGIVWLVTTGRIIDRNSDGTGGRQIGFVQDITEKKAAEAELQQQNEMRAKLIDISAKYINVALDEVDASIDAALEELGRYVGADRAYVFKYDASYDTMNNTYEWCSEGVDPVITVLQNVPVSKIAPEWIVAHKKNEILIISDADKSENPALKEILLGQSVKSLITIPMFHENVLRGFCGFDSVQEYHEYSEHEISLLIIFAQLLVNIENRCESEKHLVQAKEAAEAAAFAKSQFLATMSHEIRTPLNGVVGLTHLLLKTDLTYDQEQYLQKIISSSDSLRRIIDDVLDFSKIEAGRLELESIDYNLSSVLKKLEFLVDIKAKEKHLTFSIQVNPHVPRYLHGDPLRLEQVLLNLLSNAVKFTRAGKVTLSIDVETLTPKHVSLRFSVKDTGVGMSLNQQKRLFQPFTQADSTTTRKYGGTGLGLAISQRLVTILGGNGISVISVPDKGSTFSFVVPLGVSKLHSDTQALAISDIEKFRGAHILLAEDNEINQEVCKGLLVSEGFAVDVAENGEEAVKMVKENNYDAVLMDIQMPILDGVEATKLIRKDERFQNLPILSMSANVMADDLAQYIASGMNDTISKPINVEEFYSVLSKWLLRALPKETRDRAPEEALLNHMYSAEGGDMPPVQRRDIDIKACTKLIKKMAPLLKEQDLEAKDYVTQLHDFLSGTQFEDYYIFIEKYIEQYDFASAHSLLKQIAKELRGLKN